MKKLKRLDKVTIEVIDVINHGLDYSHEEVAKFYYPAILLEFGKLFSYKGKAFFVQREERSETGIFFTTNKKKLYNVTGKFLTNVIPAPCLITLDISKKEPLACGFGWYGDYGDKDAHPSIQYSTRLLFETFKLSMNKTQCAGKYTIIDGRHRWANNCDVPAVRSQYFHISGQIQRRLAVCDKHISTTVGFGDYQPHRRGDY